MRAADIGKAMSSLLSSSIGRDDALLHLFQSMRLAETLHIRRLENGLERPCGRSRPAPRHLATRIRTKACTLYASFLSTENAGKIAARWVSGELAARTL